MSAIRIVAILLVVAGILGLGYGGFTYTEDTHDADIGPMHLSVSDKETVNGPVWAGAGAIAVGALLFVVERKTS